MPASGLFDGFTGRLPGVSDVPDNTTRLVVRILCERNNPVDDVLTLNDRSGEMGRVNPFPTPQVAW